ncbi:MAG: ankyrin repeat domain-containing protein [Verrucomicrobiota bacterium]
MKTNQTKFLPILLGLALLPVTVQAAEIHDAAEAGDVARITDILATNRTLVQLAGKDDLTPLHCAARAGKLNAVTMLLEHGAEVNATDIHGCTPLHSAVYGRHTNVVEFLLDHQANANAARTDGTTPLYYAASHGDPNLLGLLLGRGARPTAPPGGDYIPLQAAVRNGHQAAVAMLLSAGASLEARDQNGHTPLHVAAYAGDRAMVTWLLGRGADADAVDYLQMRPVDYVTGVSNDALVLLLAQHMTPPLDQSLPVKVGDVGDLDRILFEDVAAFTHEQLRRGLAIKPGYLLAAHPQANLRPFLDELQRLVQTGYQAAGFPEAQVAVTYDATLRRVRVKVTEGPRFKAGKIRIVGNRSSSSRDLVQWLTTAAEISKQVKTLETNLKSMGSKDSSPDATWKVEATTGLAEKGRSGLNTPGKAERLEEATWVADDPVNFSEAWTTQTVAQVEACLAEQGFFFPEVKVELQRHLATRTADLLISIQREGPPGVIGEIKVIGEQRHTPEDLIRFLQLRPGMKITAKRLAEARRKLRDSGRFLNFEIVPEYAGGEDKLARHLVNLRLEVEELAGVPRLNEPLNPTQQALLRLCAWLEQFPSRDEEIAFSVRDPVKLPVLAEFALSPRRGLLLSVNPETNAAVSAGFLLANDTVQLCAWASSNKLAATRTGGGTFFLHLLPNERGSSNRFNFSVGGGYNSPKGSPLSPQRPLLTFDVQLSRAAFLELATTDDTFAYIAGRTLIVTNPGFLLRADAKTGRVMEISRPNDQPPMTFEFGGHAWDQRRGDFTKRSASLTNTYSPGHGFSSFLALAGGEVAHFYLVQSASATNGDQRRLASAAVRKLITPEVLGPMDWIFLAADTNAFNIPMDAMESAMAANSLATLYSGFAFDWSARMFPKHSWPWTAARESAFIMMNQGRYTDVELERIYNSEETGPIGFLVIAHLLRSAGSPAAKAFALQGLTRLSAQSFLADCNLFLRGDSGLARSFAKLVDVVGILPDDELAALIAVLPEAEANLLRESAAALRAQPEATAESVLSPVIATYWQASLRARVRAALFQLTTQPNGRDSGTASLLPGQGQKPGI